MNAIKFRHDQTKAQPDDTVVKSAARALDVIEFVAKYGVKTVSFREISIALFIPKSSLSKLLKCLAGRGWIEVAKEGSQYSLGHKVMTLISSIDISHSLEMAIQMSLEEIRDEFNETATFYVAVGDEVEVIKTVPSRQPLMLTLKVGARAPHYALSPGKVILAEMDSKALSAYLERVLIKPFTPLTIAKKGMLKKEIAAVRRDGVAFACEELSLGIWGIAVPLRIEGKLIGAINVAIPVARHSAEKENRIRLHIQSVAKRLGEAYSSLNKIRPQPVNESRRLKSRNKSGELVG